MFVDEKEMFALIKTEIANIFTDTDTDRNVCEMVWERMFDERLLDDEEDAAATVVYNKLYKHITDQLIQKMETISCALYTPGTIVTTYHRGKYRQCKITGLAAKKSERSGKTHWWVRFPDCVGIYKTIIKPEHLLKLA